MAIGAQSLCLFAIWGLSNRGALINIPQKRLNSWAVTAFYLELANRNYELACSLMNLIVVCDGEIPYDARNSPSLIYVALKSFFNILPVRVRGSCSIKTTLRGLL